jgi:hypothetical protein
MKLKRKYKKKFWHWDFLWNFFENIGDQWNWESFYKPWFFNKEDADYINHSRLWWPVSPLDYNEHYVIDTDYENYAVVYGCDVYFGLFKVSYATFLSRSTFADSRSMASAKSKLIEVGYPYKKLWVNAGE